MICVCTYVYIYMFMYLFMYIQFCIYIYVYDVFTYTYIHEYIQYLGDQVRRLHALVELHQPAHKQVDSDRIVL
jgi:hypothetical protein